MKHIYSVEYFNQDGEADGYFARLTDREAKEVEARLKAAAKRYDLSEPKVFAIDLDETPDFRTLMEILEERYPS